VEYDTVVTDLKVRPTSFCSVISIFSCQFCQQAIEKATNEIVKELAVLDRSDVQLQEKRKHIVTKVKKLEKSITTDTHARSEAATWVKNHGDEIIKVRKDLDKMEATLEKEEVELEKVRDGLKGKVQLPQHCFQLTHSNSSGYIGKTEVFSTQIESLQTDLQPWAEKIAEKQAAIDLAANERDLLVEKTESVKEALESAQASMEKLGNDKATKVSSSLSSFTPEAEIELVSICSIVCSTQRIDSGAKGN
jgi:structural maintenance of chromosome 4